MTKKIRHIAAWVITGLIVLITGWIGDGLEGNALFVEQAIYQSVKGYVIGGLFAAWALLAWILDKLWRYMVPLRTLSALNIARPHAVLIAPVSGTALLIENRDGEYWVIDKDNAGQEVRKAKFADGLEALLGTFKNTNLAPLLRTLQHHQPQLRQVRFLDSGSLQPWMNPNFTRDFADALNACLNGVNVEVYPVKLEFEDVESVYDALDRVVESVIDQGASERDIIVDLTGGQKPTSVALALYTLHRNIRCQYVQTGGDNRILQYDMAFQPAKSE